MRKILVVIDFQNDFVGGSLGFPGAELLDEGIAQKVLEYGEGNVFFTRDTHYENYLNTREGANLPVVHCIKDTDGWQIYGKTAEALDKVGAIGFNKLSFGLNIEKETNGELPETVHSIELVGLVSNICVLSNAVVFRTKYPEAEVIVDAGLTGCFDKATNEKALDIMEGLQVKVINRK